MKAYGDYYNAWRSEEGTANENHPINVLCALWYNASLAFSLQKQTFHTYQKNTIPPITQLSCHQSLS